MQDRSPFDYDISVTADKRRRARGRGMNGAFGVTPRGCDHPGCSSAGEYRAPKSPSALDEFYWFCLEHVRDYNRSWNFFRDSNTDELERQMEADRLWGRPTWSFAAGLGHRAGQNPNGDGQAWRRLGFGDPFELLGAKATINPGGSHEHLHSRRLLPKAERRALAVLGAREEMTKSEIRRLYKELVKQLHPDTNGGSRAEEERLQEVFRAWERLRDSRNFPG